MVIASLAELPGVSAVTFRDNRLSPAGVVAVCAQAGRWLQSLDLSHNVLHLAGCEALSGLLLRESTVLRELVLDHAGISDLGASALAPGVGRSTSLVRLSLSFNQIGGPGCVRRVS